jgi:hypothetical protein
MNIRFRGEKIDLPDFLKGHPEKEIGNWVINSDGTYFTITGNVQIISFPMTIKGRRYQQHGF